MLKAGQPGLTLLLGALIAVAPLAMDIYLASMPSMTRALSATPEAVQLTLSVYMYAWGVSQLLAGPLSDRFGRRSSLIGGLALFVVASFVCAAARDVQVLIAARAVQALGMATVAVVPRAIVRDLYSGTRAAHLLSLMGVVLGVAPIVAPILGSHLHVWLGWQANFVFVALFGATLLGFVVLSLPETLAARNPKALRPRTMVANYRRLFQSRVFLGYMLVASFAMAGLFAFLAGSSFVFVSVMGRGEQGFGWLFGLVMLGNITGAMLSSRLVRRVGIDRMIRAGSMVMFVSGLAMGGLAWARINHPAAIVAPMFVYMIGLMTTMPQAIAGALTPFPQIAGSASALLSFCQFVIASSSALFVGLAFDGTSRPMTTAIASFAVLTLAAYAVMVRRREPAVTS